MEKIRKEGNKEQPKSEVKSAQKSLVLVDRNSNSMGGGRNYYRCAAMGCMVKKKVQRDCEDPNYVITIYDGTHNHETPEARS